MVKAKRDNSAATKRYLHHFFSIFIILLSNYFFLVSWTSKIRSVRYKTKRLVVNEANGEAERGITSFLSFIYFFILF